MPNLPRSSPGSAPCRLEWRPSRWQCGVHWLIAALSPWAVLGTDLSDRWRWPVALLAALWAGAGAWRYARMPTQALLIPPGEALARVDGQPVQDLQLSDRGVLLQLAWRQHGRRHWRLFWPDTLAPAQRRELRLAVRARRISRSPPAVAP